MFSNIFRRIYYLLFQSSSKSISKTSSIDKTTLTSIPRTIHRICDDKFIENFDEIIIIGDIHGCFDEFELLLNRVHENITDPTKILKICTGDLINKGPKSKEVIEYFMANSEHCISVRGNHDQAMINEFIRYIETGEIAEKNAWLKELSIDGHFEYLRQLPYTIRIPKLNIMIVHAGILPAVPIEQQQLIDMIEMRNVIINDSERIASKYTDKGVSWASCWQGPWHIYFGHDAKRKLQQHPYATGLDTGLVYGGELTAKFVMGPRQGKFISVNALQMWKNPMQTNN